MYGEETKKRVRMMGAYARIVLGRAGEKSGEELEKYLNRWGVHVSNFDWGAWWERAKGLEIAIERLGPRGGKRKITGRPEWAASDLREEAQKIWDGLDDDNIHL